MPHGTLVQGMMSRLLAQKGQKKYTNAGQKSLLVLYLLGSNQVFIPCALILLGCLCRLGFHLPRPCTLSLCVLSYYVFSEHTSLVRKGSKGNHSQRRERVPCANWEPMKGRYHGLRGFACSRLNEHMDYTEHSVQETQIKKAIPSTNCSHVFNPVRPISL